MTVKQLINDFKRNVYIPRHVFWQNKSVEFDRNISVHIILIASSDSHFHESPHVEDDVYYSKNVFLNCIRE